MAANRPGGPAVLVLFFVLAGSAGMTSTLPVGRVASTAGTSKLNGIDLIVEATLFPGDTVTTEADSTAVVYLPRGGKVHLGAVTEATFAREEGRLVIGLKRGGLAAQRNIVQSIRVRVRGITVQPPVRAAFKVAAIGDSVYVAAEQKDIEVFDRIQTVIAPTGKIIKVEVAPADSGLGTVDGAAGIPSGRIVSSALLGGLQDGATIPELAFVFEKLGVCGPAVSPRDPDCGSGVSGN